MGKVLLSTSYSEKDDLKKMFPSATWNDVIKSWHVPLELAIAVRGSGNDIIEQNGWFDGVVGNIGEFPCQVLPHKLIMPAVSTHGLYHEGYKSSVVMSVHTNCLVPTEKIIYISYLRHANDDASEIVQFRGSVGRKIWDAVVKCGFSTNPNMTHTHVSAHKGSLIGSHPPVGKVTPTNLSKFPSTNKTTDYALQA
jgi:hypothetical protein